MCPAEWYTVRGTAQPVTTDLNGETGAQPVAQRVAGLRRTSAQRAHQHPASIHRQHMFYDLETVPFDSDWSLTRARMKPTRLLNQPRICSSAGDGLTLYPTSLAILSTGWGTLVSGIEHIGMFARHVLRPTAECHELVTKTYEAPSGLLHLSNSTPRRSRSARTQPTKLLRYKSRQSKVPSIQSNSERHS